MLKFSKAVLHTATISKLPAGALMGRLMVEQSGPAHWPEHLNQFYNYINDGAALVTAAVLVGCVIEWDSSVTPEAPYLVGRGYAINVQKIVA